MGFRVALNPPTVLREVSILECPGVYAIIHTPSNQWYIGSTTCIKQRWNEHKSQLRRGISHIPKLQVAYDEDGLDSLEFIVLETCEVTNRHEREQYYLDTYQCDLNTLTKVASSEGFKHSAESREKQRQAKLGKPGNRPVTRVTLLCKRCGKSFEVIASQADKRECCSNSCSLSYKPRRQRKDVTP